jgi:hypothetical protein
MESRDLGAAWRESRPSLCFPDGEKSCFACCPPIRPADYEHIQYRNFIERMLRDNTRSFPSREDRIVPITGFSCWGLGYVDRRHKLVGCLIHPAHNHGADRRYRVHYGEKCRRETCPEAREFLRLETPVRGFLLQLSEGMDSFVYSSRKNNPVFALLGWGKEILSLVAARGGRGTTRQTFSDAYPFFSTDLNPRGNAYLLKKLIDRGGVGLLKTEWFRLGFETFSKELSTRMAKSYSVRVDAPHTHRLTLDSGYLAFLRLSSGIRRISQETAEQAKETLDHSLEAVDFKRWKK